MEQARMTTLDDIDQLADAIAALVLSRARIPSDFWDYGRHRLPPARQQKHGHEVGSLPDFPKPIRPPTAGLWHRASALRSS
ncbi:MAG: hypothetical protein V5B38_05120 [Candidatus Accumulibacter propinquus]|jgi:hypothetical protein